MPWAQEITSTPCPQLRRLRHKDFPCVALYRYHPDVVQALHEAQQKHRPRLDGDMRAAQRLCQDNLVLREQIAKMAALVDHYFAAWQGTRLLLQRRDRELAESRRDTKVRPVSIAPEHRRG